MDLVLFPIKGTGSVPAAPFCHAILCRMRNTPSCRSLLLIAGLVATSTALTDAQQRAATAARALTADDYARAERYMPYNTNPLMTNGAVRANWLPNSNRFWYRNQLADGRSEFVMVDAAQGSKTPAFNHAALAAALSTAAGKTYEAAKLPFQQLTTSEDGSSITFPVEGKRYTCDVQGKQCTAAAREVSRNEALSPDGKQAAFIRDCNLWVRDVATGKETQLTTDGVKDFGYATDNAGWTHSDRAILALVARLEEDRDLSAGRARRRRDVSRQHQRRPSELAGVEVSAAGRRQITMIQRVVIDVERAQGRPTADAAGPASLDAVRRRLVRRRSGRTCSGIRTAARRLRLHLARSQDTNGCASPTPSTGSVRTVLDETVETFFESGNGRVNWRYLPDSNEVIWFSERDNWGHLYLYDAGSGAAEEADHQRRRQRHAAAAGRREEPDALLRRRRQGEEARSVLPSLLPDRHATAREPDAADAGRRRPHDLRSSPSGTVLRRQLLEARRRAGRGAARRRRQARDRRSRRPTSRGSLATGWKPPIPITVKARDGVDRSLRPAVSADEPRSVEEVPDRQSHLSGSADRQRRRPQLLCRRAATRRRSPSSASSSSRSTGWGRRGGRRSSTRPTTATWATTRCPIRSRA